MGILRSIESRLERVVEGSVGRLFRASVAPVELARKLAKELEEGKVVSVTQTYAPNEYTIYLSPRDRTRFADFEASLRNELASYLAEHARRAGYVMPTRPKRPIRDGVLAAHGHLRHLDGARPRRRRAARRRCRQRPLPRAPPVAEPWTPPAGDSDRPRGAGRARSGRSRTRHAGLGRAAPRRATGAGALTTRPRPVGPAPGLAALPLDPEPVAEVVPPPFVPPLPDVPPLPRAGARRPGCPQRRPRRGVAPAVPSEPRPDETMIARPEPREELVLVHDDQRTTIDGPVVQIGRAPGCDIVLDDRNVSRRHAEIRRRGPVVVLIDLDSTNGTIVNGRRVREHPLADGDRITLGNSRLTFERRTT